MVLPEGFSFPPLFYSLVLLGGLLIVSLGLLRDDPPVTSWTVLALLPWMAAGGALHVLYVQQIVNDPLRHLLGTPAVYALTAILAGVSWLVARRKPVGNAVPRPVPVVLGGLGVITLALPTLVIVGTALDRGTFAPGWSIVAVVGSVVLTAVVWFALVRGLPAVAETTGVVGLSLVFAHVLDAVSTTVGVDVLGAGERSPLPRLIMDVAASLPTADLIGAGWAFIVVKLVISIGLLWIFEPFVSEEPRQANLLLAALAAVGLGPGVHNLLLFAIAG